MNEQLIQSLETAIEEKKADIESVLVQIRDMKKGTPGEGLTHSIKALETKTSTLRTQLKRLRNRLDEQKGQRRNTSENPLISVSVKIANLVAMKKLDASQENELKELQRKKWELEEMGEVPLKTQHQRRWREKDKYTRLWEKDPTPGARIIVNMLAEREEMEASQVKEKRKRSRTPSQSKKQKQEEFPSVHADADGGDHLEDIFDADADNGDDFNADADNIEIVDAAADNGDNLEDLSNVDADAAFRDFYDNDNSVKKKSMQSVDILSNLHHRLLSLEMNLLSIY